ncbi:N-acetylmuramic acid 6-phosphate etherase [Heyndrickxia oleronia]|uniref:N-acetylmuramic acid 6-phosphate etherase n=1 Tax=Heyndrickxia oleronia TaxID=38875 RepID=A0A8E2I771_9BACI|nr:N-acetylmuramic acid 6-phosphate etherase [Heyndrickxia oleronia]OJH16438.1 N-acetylmuramic acid 6-phosphate etherase [Bacillus obstructivus]MCM3456451.1 N-acetylmuramic acid 6-phosphate etherase [Heyndrickxia oleronia]MEC1373203.1 N-acetylmuramic acid 6-phosphate etherase [Heyndrickxia oleronia]OOP67979.1 N-acetylmuramic acid 6-phosphate etherase [Heyndrickxia oleronia]QQZ04825.1 N-acetylmuramic acid 6-phosphate etherase [Heyndrickxia oleronia]
MKVNLSTLMTEQTNNRSNNIDQLSTLEIIELMNDEDYTVAASVKKVLPLISVGIELIYTALSNGGRLFYIGAGTSGRIGVLDASECPPTFCTPPELIQGIIAGGNTAMFTAVEGAEDNRENGAKDLQDRQLKEMDIVVGIAASGRTPYVIGALEYARSIGAKTIALSCNEQAEISHYADLGIEVIVGPEILTGSTRLKSATAQKMVLNMFTTATMIKLGKVYGNLMVDLNPSNIKLIERARNIVKNITGVSYTEAANILNKTDQKVKPAIVMLLGGVSFEKAKHLLDVTNGFVHEAIEKAKGGTVTCEK